MKIKMLLNNPYSNSAHKPILESRNGSNHSSIEKITNSFRLLTKPPHLSYLPYSAASGGSISVKNTKLNLTAAK